MILNDDFCSDKWMLYIQISIFGVEDSGYVMEYYDESPDISFDKKGTSIPSSNLLTLKQCFS